jgi:hypothetical protein
MTIWVRIRLADAGGNGLFHHITTAYPLPSVMYQIELLDGLDGAALEHPPPTPLEPPPVK